MRASPFVGRSVIAVVRHTDPRAADAIARTAASVLPAVEITFTVPGASALITALRDHPRVLAGETAVGAGTVLTARAAEDAITAGAAFVVSPTFVDDVAAVATDLAVSYVPGAFTPTEVLAAARGGAGVVKLFPASVLGPRFLTAMTDVFPDVEFVPTGGIDAGNVAAWIEAGAHAVGIGGTLTAAFERGGVDAVIEEADAISGLAFTAARALSSCTANGALA
jgi:2-dehydro-3-deoxyphosphogluconate aldolase/(4S)-4-hydroxy-2-oxoglutarate aldolase